MASDSLPIPVVLDTAILTLIEEIGRQDTKYPHTMPDKLLTSLGEEFGEVCRAMGRDVPLTAKHGARNELIQLAAVAVRGYVALAEVPLL